MKSFCQCMECSYETDLGKYYFSSDIRKFISHITPLCSLLHKLLKDECMICRTSENCK